jgi:hypothetical protein
MIGRVALLVTFKKANQNHKAYHEVIYVTWGQFVANLIAHKAQLNPEERSEKI